MHGRGAQDKRIPPSFDNAFKSKLQQNDGRAGVFQLGDAEHVSSHGHRPVYDLSLFHRLPDRKFPFR